ncbi:MAG: hypothetical protein E7508_10075 [Ruminococcus sp.]|nr:hypothetical protein [Ruminococcus sp.]
MIENDTIRLLRECDAGVKMGISSLDESMKYVSDSKLKTTLEKSMKENEKIKYDLQELLHDYHDNGKEPALMAKSMTWLKTNVKLAVNESDSTVADLITDGCNMGVKSLSRYMNKYRAADEKSKNIAKNLISVEEKLAYDIRGYL